MAHIYPLSDYWRTFVEEGVNLGSYKSPLTWRQTGLQWFKCLTDVSNPYHIWRYLALCVIILLAYQAVAFASGTMPMLSLVGALKVIAGFFVLVLCAVFSMGAWIAHHSKKAIQLEKHIIQDPMPFIEFYVLKLDFLNWIKYPSFWVSLPYVVYTLATAIRAGSVAVFGNTEDSCSMGAILTNTRYPSLSEQLEEQVAINRKVAGIYSLYVPEDMFTMHQGDKLDPDLNTPSCVLIHFLSKMIDTLQIRYLESMCQAPTLTKWPERDGMFHNLVWWTGPQGAQFTPWLEEAYADLEPLFQQFQKEQSNTGSDALANVQAFMRYFSERSVAWKKLSIHSVLSTYS